MSFGGFSMTGVECSLAKPYSRSSFLVASGPNANSDRRSAGNRAEIVGCSLNGLDDVLLMGVGAGTRGKADAGVGKAVLLSIELDLLIGGTTGDCSGVGRGRRRGRRGAFVVVDVWREL